MKKIIVSMFVGLLGFVPFIASADEETHAWPEGVVATDEGVHGEVFPTDPHPEMLPQLDNENLRDDNDHHHALDHHGHSHHGDEDHAWPANDQ